MSKNYAKLTNFTVNGGYFKTVHRSELYPSIHKSQHENYEPWADKNNKLLAESRFKSPDWKETAYALKRKHFFLKIFHVVQIISFFFSFRL